MLTWEPQGVVEAESLKDLLYKIEGRVLVAVLKAKAGNITAAAALLQVDRAGLYRKLERHGLRVRR